MEFKGKKNQANIIETQLDIQKVREHKLRKSGDCTENAHKSTKKLIF
jgi:hypothetical protein